MPRLQIVVDDDLDRKVKRLASKRGLTASAAGAQLLRKAVALESVEARLEAVRDLASMETPVEHDLADMKRRYAVQRPSK